MFIGAMGFTLKWTRPLKRRLMISAHESFINRFHRVFHSIASVLIFAAHDPSGGAGLAADILTLASLGCHPLPVCTALTVQDTTGVRDVFAFPRRQVILQAQCLLEDVPVAAFKLGVLGSAANIVAIAELISQHPLVPVIVDPVLASGRGDALADIAAIDALRELILPRATLITPNTLEARRLSGVGDANTLADCAARLLGAGCRHVLITGTHEDSPEVINTLYAVSGVLRDDKWPRLPGNFHGSGCTLASACAAYIARGESVTDAVGAAQAYTWNTLKHAHRIGRGQAIPNRCFASDEHAAH
jgi:hydroxymethylpyrimidine/phosphomethylpyrimidine kinase